MPLPQTAVAVLQRPAVQLWPLAQTLPQAPQLLGSLVVLEQAPLHRTCPVGQLPPPEAQIPLIQTSPDGQTWPHAPQLFGSLVVLVQVPLHRTCPVGQLPPLVAQTPLVQTSPDGQTWPHAPQFFGSLVVLVQVPLHRTCPVGQVPPPVLQVPLVQGIPVGQAVPQVPQLEGSEVDVVQMPAHNVPLHVLVSPEVCILYSTSRLASAPVFEAQLEPVRSEACRVAPAAKVNTMGPLSDQYWPGVSTRSCPPLAPSVKRKTAAGQLAPVGVLAVTAIRKTVIA